MTKKPETKLSKRDTLYSYRKVEEVPIPPDTGKWLQFYGSHRGKEESFIAYYDPKWGAGRGCWFDKDNHVVHTSKVTSWRPTVHDAPLSDPTSTLPTDIAQETSNVG